MATRGGSRPQNVYVIGAPVPGIVKVGVAEYPLRRLREAIQGAADPTHIPPSVDRRGLVVLYQQPGGRQVEKALHEFFADSWVIGEWYDLGPSAVTRVRDAIAHLYKHGQIDIGAAGLPDDIDDPRGRTRRYRSELIVIDHKAAARRLMAEIEAARSEKR